MRRRALLAGVLTGGVALVTGCSRPSQAHPSPSPSLGPPDGAPVASWALTGGYTTPEKAALRPPRLVVYADGETVADAAYRSQLKPGELKTLVDHFVTTLRTPNIGRRKASSVSIVDAPTTQLEVWDGAKMLTVSVDGLDEDRDAYASALNSLRDRLGTLYKTVTSTAQPYLAERVRVVAATSAETTAKPWPTQVPVPPTGGEDLDGQQARDAVNLLTRDLDQRGVWPTYQTTDGRKVSASWRYLLRHE
jgi:hypothetical protein